MDNSWCPRSLSIKLSGKENVGLVSQISLPYLFRSKMVCLLKKIDQKFSIAWQPYIHGTKVLFLRAGTPCKDPISDLPPSRGESNWPLSFLDYQTQSTTHCLSSLSINFFISQGKYMHYNPSVGRTHVFDAFIRVACLVALWSIDRSWSTSFAPRLSPPSPCQIRPGRFPFLRLPFWIRQCLSPIYIRSAGVMKPQGHRRIVCNNAARFSNPETAINGFVVV